MMHVRPTTTNLPVRWIVRAEPIEVDDRTTQRAFTYVQDIAAGIGAVLDAPTLSHETYNHTSEEWRTLGHVIEVLRELHPGLEVIELPSREVAGCDNRMEVTRLR